MELKELTSLDYKEKYKGAKIKTTLGKIEVEFYSEDSPATVNNFMKLAHEGFYDGIKFHRIIADFMIQGGDPNSKNDDQPSSWGVGDPGYSFPDEFNSHKLVRGSLAMANSGPNTNGSQFFIVTKEETSWLDGKHTNFGFIVNGMDVVQKIEEAPTDSSDRPIEPIVIEKITLIEK
ncbi:peptidylprolyl isomerase [bacterium]|nr:peptidylprolyl isomerase [bacterium]MBT4251329.1 peptidylprolyl isomerase [bacterium]MBT4598290.1 peptidylprolyl isomerase [bacterium]MBT6754123.1 peptidylprolyl isomerase [bacterium]MBT7037943.1 peptidylprolyl isomerase [bacterium]